MSYQKGCDAFIRRFRERFPEPDFRWEVDKFDSDWGNEYSYHKIKIYSGNTEVCQIEGKATFGIVLDVRSKFINPPKDQELLEWYKSWNGDYHFHIHRRPLRLCFANRHGKRHWLRNKPKFAKLGASLSKQIHINFHKTS